MADYITKLKINILQIQVKQFTDTHSCGIKKFQHGAVPNSLRSIQIRLSQKSVHFIHRKDLRHPLLNLGWLQLQGRISLNPAFLLKILKQCTDGSYIP